MTRDQWLASAEALLDLDARGALVPHGIGGHARTLLEEARRHLSATVPAGDGELVERLLMTAADMERKFLHRIDHPGEDWRLVNPNGETAAALLREAASRLSQAGVTDVEVQRLTEENEALRKERDGKEAEFRDKVALGATDAEILRFRDSYPNPAGGSKVFYRYTIEQARYRYADAVLSARTALSGDTL